MTTICGHAVEKTYGGVFQTGWNIYNDKGEKVAWFSRLKDVGAYLKANNPDKEPNS